MNRTVEAALVGALTGVLASAPSMYYALKLVRKTSNVLLLAPQDQQQLAAYAKAFGAPIPPGAVRGGPEGGLSDGPSTGQYL